MSEYSKYRRAVFGTRSPIVPIRKPLSAFITVCRCPTILPVLLPACFCVLELRCGVMGNICSDLLRLNS